MARRLLGPVVLVAVLALGAPAAQAAQRVASPTGTGPAGTCPSNDPCSLTTAVGSALAGDDVLLAPGTYSGAPSSAAANITVRAASTASPPTITGSLTLNGAGSRAADLRVTGSAPAIALVTAATIDRVIARESSGSANVLACAATTAITDSVCVSSDGGGAGTLDVGSGTFNLALRNVTAVGGRYGVWLTTFANAATTINATARNVIAVGSNGKDVGVWRNVGSGTPAVNVALAISNSRFATQEAFEASPGVGTGAPSITPGAGNVTAAPGFRNAGAGDYRIVAGDATIDAGSASGGLGTTDLRGAPRSMGTAVDMGAYELIPRPVITAPTAGGLTTGQLPVTYALGLPAAGSNPRLQVTPVGGGPQSWSFAPLGVAAGANQATFDLVDPQSNPGFGGTIAPPADGSYEIRLRYTEPYTLESVDSAPVPFTLDSQTQAPQLTAPLSGASVQGALDVGYTLPEAALAGSVQLILTPAGGGAPQTLTLASEAAGAAALTIDRAAPGSSPGVASAAPATAIADGTYDVTLRYRDAPGNPAATATATGVVLSTAAVTPPPANGGGTTTPPPPGPAGPAGPAAKDTTPPAITAARLVAKVFRSSTPSRARFRLSEAASVRFVLERRRGKRWVRVSSSTKRAPAGDAFIRLPRGLKKATHRLTIRATDAAGNASGPVRLSFRVR